MTAGTVYLVGGGPGDPDLFTLRAVELLEAADVVFADLSDGTGVRRYAGSARIVDLADRTSSGDPSRGRLAKRLVKEAGAGNEVVLVESGDPSVFGHTGEVTERLSEAGVPFEVVPGVTNAFGVPGRGGVPLTHRDHASSLTVVTEPGGCPGTDDPPDWGALVRNLVVGGTVVILLDEGQLAETVAVLRRNGVPDDTRAAVIERGSPAGALTITGSLETIVDRADESGVSPPAVAVIGDVVAAGERLAGVLADGIDLDVPSIGDDSH